jgi:hypothetical protein
MEPEGSLQCSQELFAGPYFEPDQSSSHHPILYLLRSILILYTHLCMIFLVVFFFWLSHQYPICYLFSQIHATCPAYLLPIDLM